MTGTTATAATLSAVEAIVTSPQPLYRSVDNIEAEQLSLTSNISGTVTIVCETGDAVERFYGVAVPRRMFTSLEESNKATPMPGNANEVIGYNFKVYFGLSDPGAKLAPCPI